MYEIFLFSGGVYRFDEFKEAVEDIGGMVLKKDLFHLSRGSSYLSDEVHVTIIIPLEDENLIRSLVDEIKGHLEKLNMEDIQKKDLLVYLSLCDILVKRNRWMSLDEIKDDLECPCPAQLCHGHESDTCTLDEIDESISKFTAKEILLTRDEQGKKKYKIQET